MPTIAVPGKSISPRIPARWRRFGPWAIVTGASDGIGRAFAEQLATAGFDLVLVARRDAVLAALAADLTDRFNVATRVIAADLSEPQAVAEIAAATAGLDIGLLVAAAGFGTSGPFAANDLAAELDMIDVNCRAVAAITHLFANRMIRRRGGAIILLSSLVGFQGVPRAANYAATKAYIQTLAEGLRVELAAHRINVLAVAPGPVKSGFAARAGMTMGAAARPATIARGTLNALGRSGTVRPGLLARLLEWAQAPLPRRQRTRIMGLVMAGMTK